MSEEQPSYEALRSERLDSYKKIWRWFLWLGWPAAILVMWLGSRIIDGLHARIVDLNQNIAELQQPRKTP